MGFQHVTSSPGYPQSDGEAERGVQTLKSILNKCDDEYLALLTYRNTPLHNGYSPAQLSMGRALKTRVPVSPEALIPKLPDYEQLRKSEKAYRAKMAQTYDQRHGVVEGDNLSPGDKVWIPDQHTEGTVVKAHETPRSFIILTPKGNVRRNRIMTRKLTASGQEAQQGINFRPQAPNMEAQSSVNTSPYSPSQGIQLDASVTPNTSHSVRGTFIG